MHGAKNKQETLTCNTQLHSLFSNGSFV